MIDYLSFNLKQYALTDEDIIPFLQKGLVQRNHELPLVMITDMNPPPSDYHPKYLVFTTQILTTQIFKLTTTDPSRNVQLVTLSTHQPLFPGLTGPPAPRNTHLECEDSRIQSATKDTNTSHDAHDNLPRHDRVSEDHTTANITTNLSKATSTAPQKAIDLPPSSMRRPPRPKRSTTKPTTSTSTAPQDPADSVPQISPPKSTPSHSIPSTSNPSPKPTTRKRLYWTRTQHTHLFSLIRTHLITTGAAPTNPDFYTITQSLNAQFEDTIIKKGEEFTSQTVKFAKKDTEYVPRPASSVRGYVERSCEGEYQRLCDEVLGQGEGKRKTWTEMAAEGQQQQQR